MYLVTYQHHYVPLPHTGDSLWGVKFQILQLPVVFGWLQWQRLTGNVVVLTLMSHLCLCWWERNVWILLSLAERQTHELNSVSVEATCPVFPDCTLSWPSLCVYCSIVFNSSFRQLNRAVWKNWHTQGYVVSQSICSHRLPPCAENLKCMKTRPVARLL